MSEILFFTVAIVVLLFFSGLFSASETALFSLPFMRIKVYQTSTDPKKRLIAHLVLEPKDLLVTVFMLNTLANILLQNVFSGLLGPASFFLKVAIPFILTLLLGEIIPKYIGLQNNIQLADKIAPLIYWIQVRLKPIRKAIITVTEPVSRFMFFFLRKEPSISKEELELVLKTSQAHGVLQAEEAELLFGYLNLQDKLVRELMRPRNQVIYHDISDPLSKLVHLFVDQKCSRIPICRSELQHLLGIMTAEQFFIHKHAINRPQDVERFLLKPFYIPETALARSLLRRFNETREELAIVVDEYGSITGLITYEDLVELVVGEISDQRDGKTLYTQTKSNEIVCSGAFELKEFNALFNTDLASKNNMMTISGWLIEKIGDIPKSGSKFETDQFLFQVLSSNENKIQRLYIRRLKQL